MIIFLGSSHVISSQRSDIETGLMWVALRNALTAGKGTLTIKELAAGGPYRERVGCLLGVPSNVCHSWMESWRNAYAHC